MNKEGAIKMHNKKKRAELKAFREMEKELNKNLNEMSNALVKEIDDMNDKADDWNIEEMSKYDRLDKISKNTDEIVKKYKGKEWGIMMGFLVANSNRVKSSISEMVGEIGRASCRERV